MKKWYIIYSICSLALFSCSEKKTGQDINTTNNTSIPADSANNSFFPVTSFLKGQLLLLDSLPVTILQVTTANTKNDTAWITKDKIRPLLQPFIADLIDKENLIPYFKESKFNDQSTDAITFTYDPKTTLPDSIALRHWDVYVDPDKGVIKRVYMVKQLIENGTRFTQQLTWQTGKWAKIVTIGNTAGAEGIQSNIKWIWDLTDDSSYDQSGKN